MQVKAAWFLLPVFFPGEEKVRYRGKGVPGLPGFPTPIRHPLVFPVILSTMIAPACSFCDPGRGEMTGNLPPPAMVHFKYNIALRYC